MHILLILRISIYIIYEQIHARHDLVKKNNTIIIIIYLLLFIWIPFLPVLGKSIEIKSVNSREYISLFDLTNTLELLNSYDIINGRGKLFYQSSFAVYQTGLSAILINGILAKSEYPVTTEEGEILIPAVFINDIIHNFYPRLSVDRKDKIFYLDQFAKEVETIQDKKDNTVYEGKDRISFIIIDPGHGGKDPGAIGKGGLKEKAITLKISRSIENYLKNKLKGMNIRFTRQSDKFVELAKRTEIANKMLKKNENGIFISIHVNASIIQSISGFETYFLSQNPSNEEARTTAALENNVIILEEKSTRNSYDDVEHIEALMLTTQIQKESSMLANSIQSCIKGKIGESKSKGVKNADFFVLRGSLMPAVLVEVGFISNNKEAKRLTNKNHQDKIAIGIGNGIIQFIKKYNISIKK